MSEIPRDKSDYFDDGYWSWVDETAAEEQANNSMPMYGATHNYSGFVQGNSPLPEYICRQRGLNPTNGVPLDQPQPNIVHDYMSPEL